MKLYSGRSLVQLLLPKFRIAMSRTLATGTFQNSLPLNFRGGNRVQPVDSVGEEQAYEPSTGKIFRTGLLFSCPSMINITGKSLQKICMVI